MLLKEKKKKIIDYANWTKIAHSGIVHTLRRCDTNILYVLCLIIMYPTGD